MDASAPGCSTWSPAGPGPPTRAGSRPNRRGSPPRSNTRPWTPSAATPTPSATSCPTRSRCLAWQCYQRLRAIYHQPTPAGGRRLAEHVIATLHTCPVPEIARLGRTLRAWRAQVLAYFDTDGATNGGTEAINHIIDKTHRLAHGFRTFTHHRLRILLAASGTRPWRINHA